MRSCRGACAKLVQPVQTNPALALPRNLPAQRQNNTLAACERRATVQLCPRRTWSNAVPTQWAQVAVGELGSVGVSDAALSKPRITQHQAFVLAEQRISGSSRAPGLAALVPRHPIERALAHPCAAHLGTKLSLASCHVAQRSTARGFPSVLARPFARTARPARVALSSHRQGLALRPSCT